VAYLIGKLIGGPLADRFQPRPWYAVILFLLTAAVVAFSFVDQFWLFSTFWVLNRLVQVRAPRGFDPPSVALSRRHSSLSVRSRARGPPWS